MVNKYKSFIILLATTVLLAGSASGCVFTNSMAVNKVKRYAKIKNVKSIGKPDKYGRIEIYDDDNNIYRINIKTGKITRLSGELNAEPLDESLPLTDKADEKRALSFITQFNDMSNAMLRGLPMFSEHITGAQVITRKRFEWVQINRRYPRRLSYYVIEVDPKTGNLYDYFYDTRNFKIQVIPKISIKQAIEATKKLFIRWAPFSKGNRRKIVNVHIETQSISNINHERLVWTVMFNELSANQGTPVTNVVQVDALTGEIAYDPHPAYN